MPHVVILSGPSCVGKSPLTRALRTFYPDLAGELIAPVLFNDRTPRPGERDGVDYHFRSREYLETLRDNPQYLTMNVRRDIQALKLSDLENILAKKQIAFFEGNPYIATALVDALQLPEEKFTTVFMSPLSAEEIKYLRAEVNDPAAIVTDVMRRKLIRRTQSHKCTLNQHDLDDIEARAQAAWHELPYALRFQWVLPNHDGEDSDNWSAFHYPLGDARKSLLDFAAMLQDETPRWAEKWPADLFDK